MTPVRVKAKMESFLELLTHTSDSDE